MHGAAPHGPSPFIPAQIFLFRRSARLLDWRFGTDPDEMQLGFSMQFFPGQHGEATVEWTYKGKQAEPAPFCRAALFTVRMHGSLAATVRMHGSLAALYSRTQRLHTEGLGGGGGAWGFTVECAPGMDVNEANDMFRSCHFVHMLAECPCLGLRPSRVLSSWCRGPPSLLARSRGTTAANGPKASDVSRGAPQESCTPFEGFASLLRA